MLGKLAPLEVKYYYLIKPLVFKHLPPFFTAIFTAEERLFLDHMKEADEVTSPDDSSLHLTNAFPSS
jgi:hypothetical protein